MKPFNYEAAMRGEKVVTRDGRQVRIIAKRNDEKYPIVALIGLKEEVQTFKMDGGCLDKETEQDLFMAPTVKEGWIVLYKCPPYHMGCTHVFETEQEAKEVIKYMSHVAITKITWEQ